MAINRSALSRKNTTALLEKINAATKQASYNNEDDRFWKPTVDTNGNGAAVIRFLPAKTEEGLPFVKRYSHGFKVGTRWFIEDCPTTAGLPCPVCDANSALWNSGYENDKETARQRKRRLQYTSNIIVIKDPKNPENEGKIFLYSYGQSIYEKLIAAMNPDESMGDEPRDPFGFFDGCVLKMRIKNKQGGFRTYDDSTVEPADDLFDGDEDKLTKVLEKMHDLEEFTKPERFMSYDALKEKFEKVVNGFTKKASEVEEDEFQDEPVSTGKEYGSFKKAEPKPEAKKVSKPAPKEDDSDDEEEEDDDLAFFKKLAE